MLKTMDEIRRAYKGSTLQITTDMAKSNGAWDLKEYCAGNVENINDAEENPVFERKENTRREKLAIEVFMSKK